MSDVANDYSKYVRFSRAGDAFYYRWAALYCLKMIAPGSKIRPITIEGSKEPNKDGECVMDMTVYSDSTNHQCVDYYQMKHSSQAVEEHMTLGKLKKTIVGFSKRFMFHSESGEYIEEKYFIVKNRNIDVDFKSSVSNIANGKKAILRIKNQMVKYIDFEEETLQQFCARLKFIDSEGNYEDQINSLIGDTNRLITGIDGTDYVNCLVKMVSECALPDNTTPIYKATVLQQLNCDDEKKVFPAPSKFEELNHPLIREQYIELADKLKSTSDNVLITAPGGVGKLVLTSMLPELLGDDYLVIRYDCFGSGSYRNTLEFRHRHKDALVQVINELALNGLCEYIIPTDVSADRILEAFNRLLNESIKRFKKTKPNGKKYLVFDAVDNAEMTASENNDVCFASNVLHLEIPKGCKLVMLSRPERLHLIKAPKEIMHISIELFTFDETKKYLLQIFGEFLDAHVQEVYRLIGGNPRVISVSAQNFSTVEELLRRLGPNLSSVENEIEQLLQQSLDRIMDSLSTEFREKIDTLCCAISVLPPDIPINSLIKITDIKRELIVSFISDMGVQIRLTGEYIRFRDESTET